MVLLPVSSHGNIGLPPVMTGSAFPQMSHTAASVWGSFSELQAFLYVQASNFARHSDRSHQTTIVQQPWLLHPNTPRFVTSPCPGYANRPNRV